MNHNIIYVKFLLSTILIVKCFCGIGQTKKSQIDTLYIAQPSLKKLGIKLFIENFANDVIVVRDPTYFVRYRTNNARKLGFGVSYRWLNIVASFRSPIGNKSAKKNGTTSSIKVKTNIFIKNKVVFDLYARKSQGFSLSGRDGFSLTDFTNTKYTPIREDIISREFGLNANYIFNSRKFSYRAFSNQTQLQKKSAGSFLSGVFYSYSRLSSDITLLPTKGYDVEKEYSAHLHNLGISIGYGHSFIIVKRWYITAIFNFGAGYFITTNNTIDPDRIDFGLQSTTYLGTGYNTQKYQFGFYTSGKVNGRNNENSNIRYQNIFANLFVNYRFDVTRFGLFKKIDNIMDSNF